MNMKSAGEISKKVLAKGSKESEAKRRFSDVDKERMDKMFELLAIEFPFFLPNNDDDARRKRTMWMSLLKNVDDKRRGKALEMVFRDFDNKGGPNISDFLKRCRVEPAHQEFRKLLPAPRNDDIAKTEISKMFKELKGEE